MNRMFSLILLFLIFLFEVEASSFNIDYALSNLEKELDLSQKTKEKNSGITIIYTRRDLEVLGIKYLHEILERTPIGFKRSRYGLIDPVSGSSSFTPLGTIPIEVFIDNVEVSSGRYHNSIGVLGDINLNFIDHIEIYIENPSLKIIQEPAFIIIKLYSKNPSREPSFDSQIAYGDKNGQFYLQSSQKNLFIFGSYDRNKNSKLKKLNLQNSRKTLFTSFSKENSTWNFFAFSEKEGGFLGPSILGLPDESFIKTEYLQLAYQYHKENELFQTEFHYLKNRTFYKKEPILFYALKKPFNRFYIQSNDILFGLSYQNSIKSKKNDFLYGIKYRYKDFSDIDVEFNDIDISRDDFKYEHISTIFLQNDYFLKENFILNLGTSFSSIINKPHAKDYYPFLFRSGFTTAINNKLTLQGQYSHLEIYPEPYLLHSIYVSNKDLESVKVDNFLIYMDYCYSKNQNINIGLGYFTSPNYLLSNSQGLIENLDQRLFEKYLSLEYRFEYKPFQEIIIRYYHQRIKNIPNINNFHIHKITFEHEQDFRRIKLSQSLVYDKKGIPGKMEDGCSVNFHFMYQIDDSLSFFIKGENIFNRGYKDRYILINPLNFKPNGFFEIPTIPRSFLFGFEWSF